MPLNPNKTIFADLLSQLINLQNSISKLKYNLDGTYLDINDGNNNISLDRMIKLASLSHDIDTTGLIESSESNISTILTLVDSIETIIGDILNALNTDILTKLGEIKTNTNRITAIRNNTTSIISLLTSIHDSDFHLIVSDIDEKLETIRDTSKIVSYIPYKFDNVGVCEQRVAYLYDNGDLVDSSMNPITISSIESDIGYCP